MRRAARDAQAKAFKKKAPRQCPGALNVLMVDLTRFELVTSRLSAGRSNQLSYRSIMVEVRGIEPLTSGLQSPRSPS